MPSKEIEAARLYDQPDSNTSRTVQSFLQSRRLSPRILQKESPATLLQSGHSTEDCQVEGALSSEVEEALTRPMEYDQLSREVDWLRSRSFNPIPIPEGRKEVQGYSWKQYQIHIMSREDFDRISQLHPCNVAIVCGQTSGNLYVADIDGPIPDDLKELSKRTLTAETGKGFHLYLRGPKPIRGYTIRPERYRVRIDVRGQGNYVICPPSLHPSGKEYRWVEREKEVLFVKDPSEVGLGPRKPERSISEFLETPRIEK